MATKSKGESSEKKSGKGKLILIIVLIVLLLAVAGGAAAWWFLGRAHGAKAPARPVVEAPKPAHFINLKPFVTNVQSQDGQTHYLQVTLDLKSDDAKVDASVTQLMPEIRSAILNILASQQAATVTQEATRNKLRGQIQAKVNQILLGGGAAASTTNGPITGVYFSGFVMQ